MKSFLIFLLRAYQRLLSPYWGHACRFYPTCSQFAIEAIQCHGCFRGGFYALRRLSRCHPWHPGGIDWVPLTKNKIQKNKGL